jgi:import inner membrane translocase subunit TIM17
MDHSRDPCPWVILNDFGGAFAMGVGVHAHVNFEHQLTLDQAVGGAVWHGVKGVRAACLKASPPR